MAEVQAKLQTLSNEYQQTQDDLQSTISARQKLESQQEENLSVQKDFKTLDPDSVIYKLVGPGLLEQTRQEATSTVDGRLEFIDKEIKRMEGSIADLQAKSEKLRPEIGALQEQQQGQTDQQSAVGA